MNLLKRDYSFFLIGVKKCNKVKKKGCNSNLHVVLYKYKQYKTKGTNYYGSNI